MRVRCKDCLAFYDDAYRSTQCPHNRFNMHTIYALGEEVYVATTLDDLEAIRLHFAGIDTSVFERLQANEHIHEKDGLCHSYATSGRLIEGG